MLIVQKYGGTSVSDVERIQAVANRVKLEVDKQNQVAIVVSAMAGVTNQLVKYVRSISSLYDTSEFDAVVASGEQVTAGLLALALKSIGVSARSWQGWQIPIFTDEAHSKARIKKINVDNIKKHIKKIIYICFH